MLSAVKNKLVGAATHAAQFVTNQIPDYVPKQLTTILLIGSTGNGKSTLSNFLLDPSPGHIYDNPTFPPARSNKPETKVVKVGSHPPFTIIDTPGLNEGESEDLEHMVAIVKKLNELQSISACVLCVKFDSKIDMQFKATIDYYQKLLPRLFEDNFIIVITNYCSDERSKEMRKRQGIDEYEVIKNTLYEVGELFHPPRKIEYYRIDALPYSQEDCKQSNSDRKSILHKASSMDPVFVSNLKVMKTPAMKRSDEGMVAKLDGEISGFKSLLIKENKDIDCVLCEVQSIQERIYSLESKIYCTKDEVENLNTKEIVKGSVWHKSKDRQIQAQSEEITVPSKYPILGYSTWSENDRARWNITHFETGQHFISGHVTGKFMRELHASLTVLVRRRDKYSEDIERLRKSKKEAEESLEKLKSELDDLLKKQPEGIQKLMERFNNYITKIKEEKLKYCLDSMTIAEVSTNKYLVLN